MSASRRKANLERCTNRSTFIDQLCSIHVVVPWCNQYDVHELTRQVLDSGREVERRLRFTCWGIADCRETEVRCRYWRERQRLGRGWHKACGCRRLRHLKTPFPLERYRRDGCWWRFPNLCRLRQRGLIIILCDGPSRIRRQA